MTAPAITPFLTGSSEARALAGKGQQQVPTRYCLMVPAGQFDIAKGVLLLKTGFLTFRAWAPAQLRCLCRRLKDSQVQVTGRPGISEFPRKGAGPHSRRLKSFELEACPVAGLSSDTFSPCHPPQPWWAGWRRTPGTLPVSALPTDLMWFCMLIRSFAKSEQLPSLG